MTARTIKKKKTTSISNSRVSLSGSKKKMLCAATQAEERTASQKKNPDKEQLH